MRSSLGLVEIECLVQLINGGDDRYEPSNNKSNKALASFGQDGTQLPHLPKPNEYQRPIRFDFILFDIRSDRSNVGLSRLSLFQC